MAKKFRYEQWRAEEERQGLEIYKKFVSDVYILMKGLIHIPNTNAIPVDDGALYKSMLDLVKFSILIKKKVLILMKIVLFIV